MPPIIVISSDSKGSKLGDLKKVSEIHYINQINKSVIKSFITKQFSINERVLDSLIDNSKSDIRLLLNNINFISNGTCADLDYTKLFYKDDDVNIFEFIDKIFDNIEPIKIEEVFKIYDTDGYLIANLIQENYLDYSNDIESISKSADAISFGDTVFADLYDSNKNFTPELHCSYSLYIPSYYSRSDIKKNKVTVRTSVNNNRWNILLNNKKLIAKIGLPIYDILFFKMFIKNTLIKSKVFNNNQIEYLRNIINIFDDNHIDRLELIYKHFGNFTEVQNKTKNFTIKFKEKLLSLIKP
jgi:hypothetical protein